MAEPTTPDEFEQRQHPDGSLEEDFPLPEDVDRPLTPDELEQRQELGDDDRDEHPVPGDEEVDLEE